MQIDVLAEEIGVIGIEKDQARVYLRLLQTGPAKASGITQFFDCSRSTVYRLLDELCDAGAVTKSLTQPTVYEATDPDELFDLGRAKLRRSRGQLERVRERCQSDLRTLAQAPGAPPTEHRWRKLEGTAKIYRTLNGMMEAATESIWSASNHEVTFAGYLPAVEEAWRLAYRRAEADGVDVRLLFDLGEEPETNIPDWIGDVDDFELRSLEADGTIHFVLVDRDDLLMWVQPAPLGSIGKRDDVAVQTDAPGSVFAHRMLFERLWEEGGRIDDRVVPTA